MVSSTRQSLNSKNRIIKLDIFFPPGAREGIWMAFRWLLQRIMSEVIGGYGEEMGVDVRGEPG